MTIIPLEVHQRVTLVSLCQEYQIAPSGARRRLKETGFRRKENGWVWDPGDPELTKVRATLEALYGDEVSSPPKKIGA